MPRMTGKKAFLEMLKAEGVKYIFGNPGTSEGPIMLELENHPELEYILGVQEGVVMGMADGYARSTGQTAFVSLHIDSGLANGLSLLNDAMALGTPMVVTAGNKDIRKLSEGRADLAEICKPFTKWSAEVTHADQTTAAVRRAFSAAATPPTGPVFLAFSANALDGEAEVEIIPSKAALSEVHPDPAAIDKAADILAGASMPVMVVGERVGQAGATAEAVELAERLGASVYNHCSGRVNFPTGHPQFMGTLSLRNQAQRNALRKADVVLAIGVDVFSDFFFQPGSTLTSETTLIHIDPDSSKIGKSEPTDLGIVSAPAPAFADLAAALAERMTGTSVEAARGRARDLAEQTATERVSFKHAAAGNSGKQPIAVDTLMAEIAAALPDHAVICDDAVSSKAMLHSAIKFDEPGDFFGNAGGAIGFGMGATLGMKLGVPERPVVAIIGDGSAMMTAQALWTAGAYNIPVVYVICNNGSYRVLKTNANVYLKTILNQPDSKPKYLGSDFKVPFDFAAIARGFGVPATRIENDAEIGPELQRAIESGGPALLDVIIDPSV